MFGQLRVRVDGAVLTSQNFGGVKPRNLLAHLVLARGHSVTKEALAERLWPTNPPKNVSGTLETYVSLLRKKLFTDREVARRVLATSAGAYRLLADHVTIDIDLFDDLVARADIPGNDRILLRGEAVGLATGDLLEDFGYEPWLQPQRELYRDRVTRLRVLLAEDHLATGAYVDAISHAEAALELRPYAEEAHRVLMLANHALGHGDAARLAFGRCRSILANELGHDLTSETENLGAAIDAGVPAAELLAVRQVVSAQAPPKPSVTAGERRDPTKRLPFFGREAEVTTIESQVHASRADSFRLVLVKGNPGMGRSALLDHLYTTLPGVVGRERFAARHRELPPLPLARSVSHALRNGSGAVDAARYANAPLLTGGAHALDALAMLLAQHAPMVLLLDDLQRADTSTFAALAWLRRRYPRLPVAVVCTTRDVSARSLRHLEMLDAHHELTLAPLEPDEHLLQAGIDAELVRVTGGVPRLLADHWRWLQAGGSGPSPSLRVSVLQSIRGLGGAFPAILQSASQLDEPFDLFDLELASPIPAADTLSALDELCRFGFLDRAGSAYQFTSPLVRDIVAATTEGRESPLPERPAPSSEHSGWTARTAPPLSLGEA